jgi:hypothetical protein
MSDNRRLDEAACAAAWRPCCLAGIGVERASILSWHRRARSRSCPTVLAACRGWARVQARLIQDHGSRPTVRAPGQFKARQHRGTSGIQEEQPAGRSGEHKLAGGPSMMAMPYSTSSQPSFACREEARARAARAKISAAGPWNMEAIMHFRGFSAAPSAIDVPTWEQRNRVLRGKCRRAQRDR